MTRQTTSVIVGMRQCHLKCAETRRLTLVGPSDRDSDRGMLERVEFVAKVADKLLVQVDPERLRGGHGEERFDRPSQLEP